MTIADLPNGGAFDLDLAVDVLIETTDVGIEYTAELMAAAREAGVQPYARTVYFTEIAEYLAPEVRAAIEAGIRQDWDELNEFVQQLKQLPESAEA